MGDKKVCGKERDCSRGGCILGSPGTEDLISLWGTGGARGPTHWCGRKEREKEMERKFPD